MSSSVFSKFDPLATHPFTNNSGLMPKPAAPSQYPHAIPTAAKAIPGSESVNLRAPAPASSTPSAVRAPQPKRASSNYHSSSSGARPIFVPFRPERSSPELDDILLKKKVSDAFANKASWSIDQSVVPMPLTTGRGGSTR